MSRLAFRVTLTLIQRLFQLFVLYPAGIVGTLLFVLVLMGHHPLAEFHTGIQQYAEEAVKPAQAGHVRVTECADPTPASGLPRPTVCTKLVTHEIPADEVVARATAVGTTLYTLLVALALAVQLMAITSVRAYVGLPPAHAQPR